MEAINLIDSFAEFKELKNIDRATLMRVLEDIFRNMLIKRYGTDENFDIIINIDKGDLEIWRNRIVVEDDAFENPNTQISLTEAKKIDADYEVGEEVTDEVKFKDFGRRSVLALRQNLSARILELEKDHIFTKYKEKVGQIVTGEVYQVWKKEILVLDDEGNELILPKQEQIPSDFFKKGDTIRAVVIRVEMKNASPYIILSRTSPVFLERLFENEVPEIFDGLITIKNVVRVPGERAKVAVESYDDRIDPVGASMGILAMLSIIISSKMQRLGDLAAGTTVIHEKKDTDLRRISFFETPESYQPTFPQIAMLSDKDMAIVREVFREFEKNKEYKLLEPLSAKIKELTGIETHMNNLQFIQTILTDYIHLTK